MADYGIQVTDNNDGTFTLTKVMRAPTTVTITGGTDITSTFAVAAETTNASGSVVNGVRRQPQDIVLQALYLVAADRSKNG